MKKFPCPRVSDRDWNSAIYQGQQQSSASRAIGALFPMGIPVITPAAQELLEEIQVPPQHLLALHLTGQWAHMDQEDQDKNWSSIQKGGLIFSFFEIPPKGRFYVITEMDRSATTILLPSDY